MGVIREVKYFPKIKNDDDERDKKIRRQNDTVSYAYAHKILMDAFIYEFSSSDVEVKEHKLRSYITDVCLSDGNIFSPLA